MTNLEFYIHQTLPYRAEMSARAWRKTPPTDRDVAAVLSRVVVEVVRCQHKDATDALGRASNAVEAYLTAVTER